MKLYINHVGEEMMKKMIMLVALMGLFSANIQAFPSGSVGKAKCLASGKTAEQCKKDAENIVYDIYANYCKIIECGC